MGDAMKRILLTALLFSLLQLHAPCSTQRKRKRPNILFVFADDWGRYASIYAKVDGPGTINDVVKTPNFDRIAREGVLFRNALRQRAVLHAVPQFAALGTVFLAHAAAGRSCKGAVWDSAIPTFPAAAARRRLSHRQELQGLEPRHAGRRAVRRAESTPIEKAGRPLQQLLRERHARWSEGHAARRGEGRALSTKSRQLRRLPRRRASQASRSVIGSARPTCIACG